MKKFSFDFLKDYARAFSSSKLELGDDDLFVPGITFSRRCRCM